jgi:asparagine synthase (glutamine-hydrolysing)
MLISKPTLASGPPSYFLNATVAMSATQRFITPECSHGLMPIRHQASECVIIADVYLTNRKNLCQQLGCDLHLSDAELMLHAYLKWGEQCTSYFAGTFCFAIWDAKRHRLMVATDQLGSCPLYYAYKPGHYFIFANEMSAFRPLCTTLSTNEALFKGFVLDAQHADETCYLEVKKLLPAHQGILNLNQWITRRYWSLKEQKKTVCYRSREKYFEAFREVFQASVCNAMRTSSAITAY